MFTDLNNIDEEKLLRIELVLIIAEFLARMIEEPMQKDFQEEQI